ncbi:hypothetical protein HNQ42_000173 [Rummeliibacillus stabekisii]|nr:hypothetical protein [Rummeliibacillus stabekisii]MBB5168810.1 hypothetical protein [Rummeliibacillus stabekisii]GEL05050.1 hypothetical protein RST01_16770 [Rummeliibacillus stabekisii]
MKNFKFLIVFIGILLIFISGCTNPIKNEEQNLVVQKRIGDENNYEEFKKISNSEQVTKVREILNNIDWENVKVDMQPAQPADYKFAFQYKNPNIEAKAVLYELWIRPNKDKVELVIDAESKYAHLDKNESAELFEILSGEKTSELK